jgi:hypothetical protein
MIEVMYSCKQCGLLKRKLSVPSRESPNVDVKAWVDATMILCGTEHFLLSPLCPSRTLDLWIPVEDKDGHQREWVGQEI